MRTLTCATLALVIIASLAAPAMAQQSAWKHVGGAPYTGKDSVAIWSAPNTSSSVKAHLWDQWAAGSKKKISVPRGSILAAVNNRGGWTLRNVRCEWETPERFPSLPAYEVSWQEGAVLYKVGKFSRDLNRLNCGNWYVIVSYQRPQPSAQRPTQPVTALPTYVINNYGGIVVTGNNNTVTVSGSQPSLLNEQHTRTTQRGTTVGDGKKNWGIAPTLTYNRMGFSDGRSSDYVGIGGTIYYRHLFAFANGGIGGRNTGYPTTQNEGWQAGLGVEIQQLFGLEDDTESRFPIRFGPVLGFTHFGEALKESSQQLGFTRGQYALDFDAFAMGLQVDLFNIITLTANYCIGERDLPFQNDLNTVSGLQVTVGLKHTFHF